MAEKQLKGKVALVTGSSTGLGFGIAMTLARAGASVVVNYFNNDERAERAFRQIEETGAACLLSKADVTDAQDIARMVKEAASALGDIDIVVVNATPDQPQRPIEEYDWDFYQQMIDFFIKSPYLLARATLPAMKRKGWGRIINIGSEVFQLGIGNFSAYVAAKGGQVGWTKSMATELAPFGITVNLVAPGWIPTERHTYEPQAAKDAYLQTVPAGRWGTPEDVGEAVLAFASEGASFITGQTLCVNGGKSPW
jgi:3-oxoacyl-[acyl-carrier protein] reductase